MEWREYSKRSAPDRTGVYPVQYQRKTGRRIRSGYGFYVASWTGEDWGGDMVQCGGYWRPEVTDLSWHPDTQQKIKKWADVKLPSGGNL